MILLLGMGYLFTLLLFGAYGYKHTKNTLFKTFLFAKCSQTIAWFFMAFRGDIPDFLSISIANSILFLGSYLEITVFLSLQHAIRTRAKMIHLALTILSIIGFQLIVFFNNEENIRIAFYSFATAVIFFPSYRIISGRTTSLLMKIIGYFYLLVIAGSFIRGGTALLSSTVSTSLYTPGIYQLISLVSMYLLTNLGSIGFILLMKEKDDCELIHLASYDDLTGTLNRRIFTERAKPYLTDSMKKRQSLSYILLDIDCFKLINDTYGHHIGDQVLQDLTAKINQYLEKDDLFVRYGGDEFGILLPGRDEIASNELAERIKQSLTESSNRQLPTSYSISMGVLTVVPDSSTQLEHLYTACDKALYKAKCNGRNGIFRSQLDEYHAISS